MCNFTYLIFHDQDFITHYDIVINHLKMTEVIHNTKTLYKTLKTKYSCTCIYCMHMYLYCRSILLKYIFVKYKHNTNSQRMFSYLFSK